MALICLIGFSLVACEKTPNEFDPTDQGSSTNSNFKKGTLPGKFSVSSEKQIQFSQGNLQYQASTNTWRFAEHQYDNINTPNVNIPTTYSGWIDGFRWGTGSNPLLSTEKYSDYSYFIDWGTNVISNGGNEANMWRTLTKEEWMFIFHERENATTLFGLGNVNGINGIILLPDSWIAPSGVTFNVSTKKGLSWDGSKYVNSKKNNFEHNSYNLIQWEKMESAGAVFLPSTLSEGGCYWASTHSGQIFGYRLSFDSVYVNPQDANNVLYCLAVRLVR